MRAASRGRLWVGLPAGAVAVWSIGPLVWLLTRARSEGGTFSGADGPFAADQLQYLAWIREAGDHVLVSNLFDVESASRVFLHPIAAISGIAWRAGLPVQAAYLVWKPVAIVVLVGGFAAYVRRMVPGGALARGVTLAVALFMFSPTAPLARWAGLGSNTFRDEVSSMAGEMFPAGWLWGYLPAAIAVGLVPLALLGAERLLAEPVSGRRHAANPYRLATAAAGLFAAWLHPWQGVTLLLVFAGMAVLRRRPFALLVPAAATVAPLVYYLVLSRTADAWRLASEQTQFPRWSLLALVLGLAPLALPAAAGFGRPRPRSSVQEDALVLWPLAALVTYAVVPSFPFHALQGVSLPLVILGAGTVRRLALPRATVALGALTLTLPGMVLAADTIYDSVRAETQAHVLSAGERAALRLLRGGSGAVLTDARLAAAIPSQTGRPTWIGHPSWTPHHAARSAVVDRLFAGRLTDDEAIRLIVAARARSVVVPCASGMRTRGLQGMLGPLVVRSVGVGCVSVHEMDPMVIR